MVTFYAAAAPQDFNALTQSYSPNQKTQLLQVEKNEMDHEKLNTISIEIH